MALVALALAWAPAAQAQPTLEARVKAAFLAKFAAFTDWPPSALQGAPAIRICVAGADPFGPALDAAARGQVVAGRPIAVIRMPEVSREAPCHILYVGGDARQSPAAGLAEVRGAPILTVTDSARGASRGMVHFVVFEDRVRFYVDQAEANRSGLQLSSKLLSVALTVKR